MSWPNLRLISIRLEGHKDARKEKGVAFGLRALVLQCIEDSSDREMARFLRMEVFCRRTILENGFAHWAWERSPRITVTLVIFGNAWVQTRHKKLNGDF